MMGKFKRQNSKVKNTIKNFPAKAGSRLEAGKRRKKFCILLFSFAFCILNFRLICFAASAKQGLKLGNRLYQEGKLDEALEKYNQASVALPDSDVINFNMGAAEYKKADYQKAQGAFTRALTSDNKKIEADALYNLGNCKYRLGKLKENTNLSATVGLLRESLDYYKRAVEIDQKNEDARFNHEFVEKELKVLLDKLKQQESAGDKQKNQQGEQQEQQKQGASSAGKESSGSIQGKQGKDEKEQPEKKDVRQQEENKEGQGELTGLSPKGAVPEEQPTGEQKKEGAAQEGAQQEGENKKLSEEEARTLLERYGQEETAPDYMDKQTQRRYDREVLKDW